MVRAGQGEHDTTLITASSFQHDTVGLVLGEQRQELLMSRFVIGNAEALALRTEPYGQRILGDIDTYPICHAQTLVNFTERAL
ncbi:hypothetical protein D3C78_1247650 [compost metagenome]